MDHATHGYVNNKDELRKRLRRAEGQVRGIARMVDHPQQEETPMSNPTNDLGLSDKNSGGGCACCAAPEQKTADVASVPAGLVSTDLGVTGMTCGHCVSSVTEEISALEGVQSVNVQLNVGGVSTVTVASASALDAAAIRAAVDEAGYSLAEV